MTLSVRERGQHRGMVAPTVKTKSPLKCPGGVGGGGKLSLGGGGRKGEQTWLVTKKNAASGTKRLAKNWKKGWRVSKEEKQGITRGKCKQCANSRGKEKFLWVGEKKRQRGLLGGANPRGTTP